MSLILDALNRSQRERKPEGAGAVLAPQAQEMTETTSPVLLRILAVALALSLLALGGLLLERLNRLAPSTTVLPPTAPIAEAGPPAAMAVPEAATVGAIDALVARAPAPPAVTAPAAGADAEVAALYANAADGEDTSPVPAKAAADMTAGNNSDIGPALDVDAIARRAREQLGKASLPQHPAPLLAALSQQQKNQIPSLMYLRHDYASTPEKSYVVINKQQLREGDSVAGVRVQEIHPDFVVLRYRELTFRLRALNSWVNL